MSKKRSNRGLSTRRIGGDRGIDVNYRAFLFAPVKGMPETWRLPVFDPRGPEYCKKLIAGCMYRLEEALKRIPVAEHARIRLELAGAAQSHGLSDGTDLAVQLSEEEIANMLGELAASKFLRDGLWFD